MHKLKWSGGNPASSYRFREVPFRVQNLSPRAPQSGTIHVVPRDAHRQSGGLTSDDAGIM